MTTQQTSETAPAAPEVSGRTKLWKFLQELESSRDYAAKRLFMARTGQLGRLTQKGISDHVDLVKSYDVRMAQVREELAKGAAK